MDKYGRLTQWFLLWLPQIPDRNTQLHSVFVRGLDLLDGTPVLDIKPYVLVLSEWHGLNVPRFAKWHSDSDKKHLAVWSSLCNFCYLFQQLDSVPFLSDLGRLLLLCQWSFQSKFLIWHHNPLKMIILLWNWGHLIFCKTHVFSCSRCPTVTASQAHGITSKPTDLSDVRCCFVQR